MENHNLISDQQEHWSGSKIFLLILIELIPFSYHFGYENLQAIQTQLIQEFDMSLSQYNLLYSVTDLPSIIIPLMVTLYAKKMGLRMLLITMTTIISIGMLICAVGGYLYSYPLLLLGRFLYGLFLESCLVCSQLTLHLWFTEREFSLAISAQSIIMGLSKSSNSFFVPRIMETTQAIGNTIFCCFLIGSISFFAALFYLVIEPLLEDMKLSEEKELINTVRSSYRGETKTYWQTVKELPQRFWILVVLNALFQGCFFGLSDVLNDYIHVKFGLSNSSSGDLIVLMYLTIAFSAPIMAHIAHSSERRGYLLIASSGNIFCVFLIILGISNRFPVLNCSMIVILAGLFWATFHPTIYGIVAEIVDKSSLGIAYSFLSITSEVGVAILPLASAFFNDLFAIKRDYTMYMIFNLLLTTVCLGLSLFFFKVELECCGYSSTEHEKDIETKIDEDTATRTYDKIILKNQDGTTRVIELRNSGMLLNNPTLPFEDPSGQFHEQVTLPNHCDTNE